MIKLTKTSAALLALLSLSACGGSGSSSGSGAPTIQEATAMAELAENDITRIRGDFFTDGIPGTVVAQIPTSGSATFTGPGLVSIFDRVEAPGVIDDTSVVDMLGTARVTVDFETGNFNGQVSDMFAGNLDLQTDLVDGEIALTGSNARGNDLTGTASGTVSAFGTSYDVAIPIDGKLRGTNPGADIPVRAIDLAGEGTVANSELLADIIIVGDKFTGGGTGEFVNR